MGNNSRSSRPADVRLSASGFKWGSSLVPVLFCVGLVEAQAQGLKLKVFVGKDEFFQGEPIYVVIQLSNPGPDTAWIPFPTLGDRRMKAKLSRVDGTVVPGRGWNISVIVPEGWRGEPLPPRAANYQSLVLQDTWGAPRRDPSELFIGDVPVGAYTFEAEFSLSLRGEPAAVVYAEPVQFVIRPATAPEDAEYEEVKAIRKLAWERTTRAQYVPALVEWATRRLAIDSGDPYVPFLLNEGMQTAYAVGAKWPREEFRQRLFTLRLAVAAAQRDRPAGAHALSSAFGMDPAPTAAMPGSFDGTLVGAVGAQLEMQRKEYHCATCR